MTKPLCDPTALADALYSASATRQIEQQVIQSGVSGYALMSRAAHAAFEALMHRRPGLTSALVLCGSGNNGGDGYLLAGLLQQADIRCLIVALQAPKTEDAVQASAEALGRGIACMQWVEWREQTQDDTVYDVIVDAMLGTGINRLLTGAAQQAVRWVNQQSCPVFALDIPSGLHADTGQVLGDAVIASDTLTFITKKFGLLTGAGKDHIGQLTFASLNVDTSYYRSVTPMARLIQPQRLHRRHNSHKGSYGRVAVIGGSAGMDGAVLLAGSAALRCGAGLVHVVMQQRAGRGMLELMVAEFNANNPDEPCALDLSTLDAIIVGCGLGTASWSRAVYHWIKRYAGSQVWDADALRLLANDPHHNANRIITPHPGEAAALLRCQIRDVQADRYAAVMALQKRFGGVVVLKGSGTLVASETAVAVCDLGNPGMASAGTGDALSGIIGALLGQGLAPFAAAKTGVWLHARAGDLAAAEVGQIGMVASDMVARLPAVIQTI